LLLELHLTESLSARDVFSGDNSPQHSTHNSMFRTGFALYFLIGCWAVAGADNCGINADGPSTCAGSDQTTLLQSRVQVSIDDTDPLSSEAIDEAENPLHPLGERNPNFLNEEGATAVCGSGEEVVSTNCLGDSLVKSQARSNGSYASR